MTLIPSTVDTVLRSANPVPNGDDGLDDRAELDLRRIVATPVMQALPEAVVPRRALRRAPRPMLVVASAVALLALSAVVVGAGVLRPGGGTVAYAATPDRLTVLADVGAAGLPVDADAETVLATVAARAAALADDTGSGRYARMQQEGWSLWTSVDGGEVDSEIVPHATTIWATADGSGRRVSTRQGPGGDSDSTDETVAAGGRTFLWPLGSLSAVDADLARQLEQDHPVSNGPAERLVAVTDLVAEQPLRPRVRAAVLRYLSRTPGLTVDGIVADRAGRRGVSVHLDTTMSGLPERRTLIIDPDDGRLLGAETLLTETAGDLDVPVPSVISYTTFRSARYTDDRR